MLKVQKPLIESSSVTRRWLHLLLLILITALTFSNTLSNGYHLDSIHRVRVNTEINTVWPVSRFFTDARTGSSVPQLAEYRPMMPLSHSIDVQLSRSAEISRLTAFHVGNIATHIASAILVYFIFLQLLMNWSGPRARNNGVLNPESREGQVSNQAFAAALLFAVHPIAGSAVNYIAGRDLLLMVFFLLVSMLVYMRMRKQGDSIGGWLSALAFLWLALMSKQAAIVAFGLVFLFEWILAETRLRDWRLWGRTTLFGIPTAGYFLLRWLWITQQSSGDNLRTFKDFTYPLTMLKAHLFYYMKNFAWPFEMRAVAYIDKVDSLLNPAALAGLLFITSTFVLAWYLRKRQPLITFAILAYWLFFALTSSIFPFRYVVTDYRQYLPLVFLSLAVVLGCFQLKSRAATHGLLAGMVLYFSLSSFYLNTHWKTEESFWLQSVKYGGSALAHSNYGLAVLKKDESLAEHHYKQALKLNPFHIYANINLGMLYVYQERGQEGLAILKRTVSLNPDWALAHYWLSRGLGSTEMKDEQLVELKRAADLDPRQLQYQYEAARALQSAGDKSASIRFLERVVSINADYRDALFLLAFAHQKTGQTQRAVTEYEQFLEIRPEHVQTHFNLAYALMKDDELEEAITHFERVLSLKPQYKEAHYHLANCYRSLGDEVSAARHEAIYKM